MNYRTSFKFILYFSLTNFLFPHCQIPCGVYNDALRIIQINEHLVTINKAMTKIEKLSQEDAPLSKNQLNRWIMAKEDHATKIQRIVSDYFLTQRIKASNGKDYIEQTISLQKLLVTIMKCKQTLDTNNVLTGQQLINQFVKVYFDEHGINHLENLNKNY